jgi:hypothetical protein
MNVRDSRAQSLGVLITVLASLVACAAEERTAVEPAKQIIATTWNLCDYKQVLDGQYQGITVASDGNCYFGSYTHSRETGASFFKFDRKLGKITLAQDVMEICGEKPGEGIIPQGKLHSEFFEMDGWLYTATHCSLYNDRPGYPGSHVLGYELATGKFRDFGILEKGYTCYSGFAGDPKNTCLYVYLLWPGQANEKPCLLYRISLPDGAKTRAAELLAGGYDAGVYTLYVDNDGNCWLPEPDGVLVKYSAASTKLERLPDALPEKSKIRSKGWMWAHGIPGVNKALMATEKVLYEFDPKEAKFRLIKKDMGTLGLGMTLAGNLVYFTQNEGVRNSPIHLKSLDYTAAEPVVMDYGQVTDQDGRKPARLESVAADADGNVYVNGDWLVKPGDKPTLKNGEASDRSERFGVVKVPVATGR